MHAHDHDEKEHAATAASNTPVGYYEVMETALRELLVEKRMIAPGEIRRQIEVLDSRNPALGAAVVAKAWVDPAFRSRLLDNGRSACEELGISFYDDTQLIVLENTDTVHNLIVCTLCSCYPRPVLGLPPDWYKDLDYRARVVRQSRTVLREMGLDLPPEIEIKVWDTTADTRYMVLPVQPPHTVGWPEEKLVELVSKESMIGVARL